MRRIGVLMNIAADDAEAPARVAAFAAGAAATGLDHRPQLADRLPLERQAKPIAFAETRRNWSRSRRTSSSPLAARMRPPLQQATRTVPIVFLSVNDPVGGRLCREPGATGRQLPRVSPHSNSAPARSGWSCSSRSRPALRAWRSFVIRRHIGGVGQLGAIQGAAPSLGVEVSPVDLRDAAEIERAIAAFARGPNGGLIVVASALAIGSSRADHRAGGAAPIARGLCLPRLRRSRRPDLLRA